MECFFFLQNSKFVGKKNYNILIERGIWGGTEGEEYGVEPFKVFIKIPSKSIQLFKIMFYGEPHFWCNKGFQRILKSFRIALRHFIFSKAVLRVKASYRIQYCWVSFILSDFSIVGCHLFWVISVLLGVIYSECHFTVEYLSLGWVSWRHLYIVKRVSWFKSSLLLRIYNKHKHKH